MGTEYGALRANLLVRVMAERLTPQEVAQALEQFDITNPQLRAEVWREAQRYRGWGLEWRRG